MVRFIFTNLELVKMKNTPTTLAERSIISLNKNKRIDDSPELKAIYFLTPSEEEAELFHLIYNSNLPELDPNEEFELISSIIEIEDELINKGSIKYFSIDPSGYRYKKIICWNKFSSLEN